jgi:DNA-binding CsgD family transcriptional regulator
MRADLDHLLSDLDSLNSEQDFRAKFERTFREFGFNLYCYAGVRAEPGRDSATARNPDDAIVLTNVPAQWTDRYVDENYTENDPILRESALSRLPLTWTERLRSRARSSREDKMFTDAFDFGIRRGMTVPIHGPSGEFGVMSLYSDLTDREFMKRSDVVRYDVHMAALYLHDAVQRTFTRAESTPKPLPLTEREVEILRWTAIGKTAWEIGSILKISERTVNFHLQNLMNKLGVHNKTHAAAKAMSFGLIHA